MALPRGTDVEFLGENASGGMTLGQSTTELISFYGVTPVVQPSGAAEAQLSPTSLVTSAGGFGFYNATLAASFVGQVDEIRRVLTLLGLWKGSS